MYVLIDYSHSTVLAFGASKAILGYFQLPLPLEDTPPSRPITTDLNLCNGAVLALDFHPTKRWYDHPSFDINIMCVCVSVKYLQEPATVWQYGSNVIPSGLRQT